jgi:hypothetical protein
MVQSSLADDAKYITKDTPAPFTGFLITVDKAEKIRLMDIDLRLSNTTNEILTKQNDLLKGQVDHLSKELVDSRDSNIWGKIGFFLIGAVLTGGIAIGVSRAVR